MSTNFSFSRLGDNAELVVPFKRWVVKERERLHIQFLQYQHLSRDVAPIAALAFFTPEAQGSGPMPDVVIEYTLHNLNAERARIQLELFDTIYLDCALKVSESALDFAGKNEVAFYSIWQLYMEHLSEGDERTSDDKD